MKVFLAKIEMTKQCVNKILLSLIFFYSQIFFPYILQTSYGYANWNILEGLWIIYIYIYKKYLFHTTKVLKKLVSDIINTVLEKCKAHKPVWILVQEHFEPFNC